MLAMKTINVLPCDENLIHVPEDITMNRDLCT